jgi:beta-xylosidase
VNEMIEAVMLWNEPNNLSHWDFKVDPEWKLFAEMIITASRALRRENPELPLALGGISPIDPNFISLMASHGVLAAVDVLAVHGFPLDWNHWQIHEWPAKIREIQAVTGKPVWVSEAGVSSFGADEVQVFGIQRTAELLLPIVERVHWYSLMDLPATWTATTRHKEGDCCAKMAHPNPRSRTFPTGWASASGFTLKIPGLTVRWSG